MRSKHKHSHRRYNGRRRSERFRSKLMILLILLFAIVVFVGTVFLGNHLKRIAEISEDERKNDGALSDSAESTDTDANTGDDAFMPEAINSSYVSMSDIDAFVAGAQNGDAVSIIFRDFKGDLYYSSPSAQLLGAQNSQTNLVSADDIMGKLKEKDCYVSAFLSLQSLGREAAPLKDALVGLEVAMIKELAMAGADEIILCGFDVDDISNQIADACNMAESFRESYSDSVLIGVLLPYSLFLQDDAKQICNTLADAFDVITVDYTDAEKTEEVGLYDVIKERIDTMQLYFSRYAVRAVLDYDNADKNEAQRAFDDSAINLVHFVSCNALLGRDE